jgi:hypothetical protein
MGHILSSLLQAKTGFSLLIKTAPIKEMDAGL